VLSANGTNPMTAILVALASGLYPIVIFITNLIATLVYYAVTEIDAILCAGFSAVVSLVSLVTLPLIAPIA
jgi:hypothetical protein